MSDVEDRIAKLEREVAELKRAPFKTRDSATRPSGWIKKITGTFKDDPEFDEILRLGRQVRKSDVIGNGFVS
jgi:hypothetical protein